MSRIAVRMAWFAVCLVPFIGCSGSAAPHRKKVVPVSGVVVVDGAPPDKPIRVECHDEKGLDSQHPTITKCESGEGGKFALSTYQSGDGVPAGNYTVTFTWGEMNPISMQYSGDKFKGRYSDPKKSEVKFTVAESDKAVDLGRIELKTK
jgi:hypothetical protein